MTLKRRDQRPGEGAAGGGSGSPLRPAQERHRCLSPFPRGRPPPPALAAVHAVRPGRCCWRSDGARSGPTPPVARRRRLPRGVPASGRPGASRLRIAVDRGLSVPHRGELRWREFRAQGHAHPAAQAAARPGRGPGLRSEASDQRVDRSARNCRARARASRHRQLDLGQASVRGLPSSSSAHRSCSTVRRVGDPSSAGDGILFKAQRLELHGRQGRIHLRRSGHRHRAAPQRRRGGETPSAGGQAGRCRNRDRAARVDDPRPSLGRCGSREWQGRNGN